MPSQHRHMLTTDVLVMSLKNPRSNHSAPCCWGRARDFINHAMKVVSENGFNSLRLED
jgi:hypothetical protein